MDYEITEQSLGWWTVSLSGRSVASYKFEDWGGRDKALVAAQAYGKSDPVRDALEMVAAKIRNGDDPNAGWVDLTSEDIQQIMDALEPAEGT